MKDENYKKINKEVSRQITMDDCRVLNFLKRKNDKEEKRYQNKYIGGKEHAKK